LSETTASLSEAKPSGGFRSLIRRTDYSKLWLGQLVSNIGWAIASMALLFFANDLTGSPLAMAFLAIVETVPVVLFSGLLGVYIDRWDRQSIMVASDLIRMVMIVLIPLSVHLPFLPTIYWVYLFTFVFSSANAWFFPARSASIPNLVDETELIAANSLSQLTFMTVQLAIPPLGAVLIAFLAPDYFFAFALNGVTFALSAILLKRIKTDLKPKGQAEHRESVLSQVRYGAQYVAGNVILVYIFVFAMLLAVSSGILNALILPHIEGTLGLGEIEFGIMLSGGAATGIVLAVLLGHMKRIPRALYMIAAAGLLAGLATIFFAIGTGFTYILLSWCVIGSMDVLLNIPLSTIMQELVDDKFRGRVFSLLNLVFTSFQVVGMGLGGVWAEVVASSVVPLLAGGIGFVAVSLIALGAVKKLGLQKRLDIMLSKSDSNDTVARTQESDISETLLEAVV
jgi:MFS family permease